MPSHTTTETAKKVINVSAHYNFFSQLQIFCQQFYIWTTIFTTSFLYKNCCQNLVVCGGLNGPSDSPGTRIETTLVWNKRSPV